MSKILIAAFNLPSDPTCGANKTAKQTHTDTALGVAKEWDWLAGNELSCFWVRERQTFCAFVQFRSVANTPDKPKRVPEFAELRFRVVEI